MPNGKTGDDGAAIDPRYDPAFQRGFDGEVATGPRGQSTLRRTAAVNPAPARMPVQPAESSAPDSVEASPVDPAEPLPTLAPMPDSSAESMIRWLVASSVCGPKFMVPRQSGLTRRPVRPRCR